MLKHPERIMTLQQAVGHSVFQCQALEQTLVHCLLVGHRLDRDTQAAIVEETFAKLGELTLGHLIAQLSQVSDFPDELILELKTFKRERNWLAHRSWNDTLPFANLDSTSRIDDYIQRILLIGDEALRLNKMCVDILDQRTLKLGVSKELLDETTKEIYRRWVDP